MEEDFTYNVISSGELIDQFDLSQVQIDVAKLFNVDQGKANAFVGQRKIIKKDLSLKKAQAYKQKLESIGLEIVLKQCDDVEKGIVSDQKSVGSPIDSMSLVPRDEQDDCAKQEPAALTDLGSKSYATVVEQKQTSGIDLKVVYDAPESDLSHDGDDVSIGGWLRFFQVVNVLSIVIGGLVLLGLSAMVILVGFDEEGIADVVAACAEMFPAILFSVLIVRVLGDRNENTPARVAQLLKYNFSAAAFVFIAVMALFFADVVSEKPTSILGSLLYYYIWTSYFKKSKRVNEYYGANTAV